MRIRTLATVVAFGAMAALGAGCTGDGPAAAPSPGTSRVLSQAEIDEANAKAPGELAASFATLTTSTYRYTLEATQESGSTLRSQGAVDPAGRTADLTVTIASEGATTTVQILVFGTDVYVKYPPGAQYPKIFPDGVGQGKWLHLDVSRITLKAYGIDDPADPSGGATLARLVGGVETAGERRYSGTLDFTKAAQSDPERLALLGDSAAAVPFEATLDEHRHLATVTYTTTAHDEDARTTVTFSDYGLKVEVARPAPADVVEAPETLYRPPSA